MKRTYVDYTGDYYDNLDKVIDLTNEKDMHNFDINDFAKTAKHLINL